MGWVKFQKYKCQTKSCKAHVRYIIMQHLHFSLVVIFGQKLRQHVQEVSKCARIGLACWPSPWNPRIPTFMPATWNGVSENLDDCCWFRCFPSNVLKPIVWFCHKCLTEHKKESFLPIRALLVRFPNLTKMSPPTPWQPALTLQAWKSTKSRIWRTQLASTWHAVLTLEANPSLAERQPIT